MEKCFKLSRFVGKIITGVITTAIVGSNPTRTIFRVTSENKNRSNEMFEWFFHAMDAIEELSKMNIIRELRGKR